MVLTKDSCLFDEVVMIVYVYRGASDPSNLRVGFVDELKEIRRRQELGREITHVTESHRPANIIRRPSLCLVKWGIFSEPFFSHS